MGILVLRIGSNPWFLFYAHNTRSMQKTQPSGEVRDQTPAESALPLDKESSSANTPPQNVGRTDTSPVLPNDSDLGFIPSPAQPPRQRYASRHPNSQRDFGIDIATPVSSHVSLMPEPAATGDPVKIVSIRDVLALISRQSQNGWYDVIDVHSGKEGWVNENDVRIGLTKHPTGISRFHDVYTGYDAAPSVTVQNNTDRDLSLKIDGTHYTLPPRANFLVPIPAGSFSYYATEPGVIPAIGKQEFKRSHRYTWTFWVEKTIVPIP